MAEVSIRLGPSSADQPFFLPCRSSRPNTSTRLLPFLYFMSQPLPSPLVSLLPAASHPYSQLASLIIVGCFLFFSTCISRALLSVKRQPIIILWRPFFGACLPQTGPETSSVQVSPTALASHYRSSLTCPREKQSAAQLLLLLPVKLLPPLLPHALGASGDDISTFHRKLHFREAFGGDRHRTSSKFRWSLISSPSATLKSTIGHLLLLLLYHPQRFHDTLSFLRCSRPRRGLLRIRTCHRILKIQRFCGPIVVGDGGVLSLPPPPVAWSRLISAKSYTWQSSSCFTTATSASTSNGTFVAAFPTRRSSTCCYFGYQQTFLS
ncbi:hypothetical protein B296_00051917 [Ensete ventricosum]|uniref:Uncharacterized protein n=1 Tax=Ensete ventricosum TaxID=4639 RepID=A0A426YEM0_ENSVE|nr:hypothetical protein B296_00051917 [Ensete ventricosum]